MRRTQGGIPHVTAIIEEDLDQRDMGLFKSHVKDLIERDLISKRTKEALRAKKESGAQLGRPRGPGKSKLDAYKLEIEALLAHGSSQKFIANRYGTTEANLHNWMKKRGIKRKVLKSTINSEKLLDSRMISYR